MNVQKKVHFFLLTIVVLFVLPIQVLAQPSNTLSIHYKESDSSPRNYKVWKINPEYAETNMKSLNKKKTNELDDLFKESFISKAGQDNFAVIEELPDGLFYGLEVNEEGEKELRTVPFVINLPYQNTKRVDIFPKQAEVGQLTIKVIGQVDSDNEEEWKDLAGVSFYIYAANSNQPLLFKDGYFTTDADGKAELKSNALGEINLFSLPAGDYVLVEVETVDGYSISRKIYFTIEAGELTKVLVTKYLLDSDDSTDNDDDDAIGSDSTTSTSEDTSSENEEILGGQHFRKVNHKKPAQGLVGARFEVVTWNTKNREFEDVLLENKEKYVVESDERGYFKVNNLPLGKYYLIEVKAPMVQGLQYQPLEEAIPFEITRQSYTNYSIVEIVNKPFKESEQDQDVTINRPQKPHDQGFLPSTGEATTNLQLLAYVIVSLGLVLLLKQGREFRERNL
ncbi:collagen binding domain-containing protein [Facklamia sp. 7083-14-GEN3]|uniref:MSCRAMM family protein n=1 Tax=Facklamia sp. 7083-14-GEN3 TaxID=2973478 RepID=UPI00215C2611|nr:SpaA isopeptide-forming pilin-related protein [Facklamia sp. 7083-14-GEN3]MCR8968885.1 SpaA isopeptide-forming pilin-related protein [Facklamia sp. 7083-14-GEN3]